MQSNIRCVFLVFIWVMTSACTAIFTDDFEADPVGEAPLLEPAGAPDDSLSFFESAGSVTVTNVLPLVGSKSLLIQGPGGDDPPTVIMRAEPFLALEQPVFVVWQGRLVTNARVQIRVFSGISFEVTLLRINLEDGLIFVDGDSVGSYTANSQHGFQIGFFPNSGQYRLTSTGATDQPEAAIGSIFNADAFPNAHIGMRVELLSAESTHNYRMDEVTISYSNN